MWSAKVDPEESLMCVIPFDTLFSIFGMLIVLCVLYAAEVIGHPSVSLSIAFMSPEI